jgi:hypothetical protein
MASFRFRLICSTVLVLPTLICGAQTFPPKDRENPPKSRVLDNMSALMCARNNVPLNSSQPLLTFGFSTPGASGAVFIDGEKIQTFADAKHLEVRAQVSAGQHRFDLRLAKPATLTANVEPRRL